MLKVIILLAVTALAAVSVTEYINERDRLARAQAVIVVQWAQLDTDLRKRADLIPQLKEAANAIPGQGAVLSGALAEAGAKLAAASVPKDAINANSRLNSAIGKLLVAVEGPTAPGRMEKAGKLLFELAERENHIFQSRRRYNDSVKDYNVMLSRFPANLVGMIGGFERDDDYFKTDIKGNALP